MSDKKYFGLTAKTVSYDEETDTYVYDTGMTLEDQNGYAYAAIVMPGESDAYLTKSVFMPGERIILKYKNRTAWPIICMFEEWKHIKKATEGVTVDSERPAGEIVVEMKKNVSEGPKSISPLDYKPFEVGEKIGYGYLVEIPDVIVD